MVKEGEIVIFGERGDCGVYKRDVFMERYIVFGYENVIKVAFVGLLHYLVVGESAIKRSTILSHIGR
jgi:hypothetical protein